MLFLSILLISKVFHNCDSNFIDIGLVNEEVDYIIDCQSNIKLKMTEHVYIRSILIPEGNKSLELSTDSDFVRTKLVFSHGNYIRFLTQATFYELELRGEPVIIQPENASIKVLNLYTNNENITLDYVSIFPLSLVPNDLILMAAPETIKVCLSKNVSQCDDSYLTEYDFINTPADSDIEVIAYPSYDFSVDLDFPNHYLKKVNLTTHGSTYHLYIKNLKTVELFLVNTSVFVTGVVISKKIHENFNCDIVPIRSGVIQTCQIYFYSLSSAQNIKIINGDITNIVQGDNETECKINAISTCKSITVDKVKIEDNSELFSNCDLGSVKIGKNVYFYRNITSNNYNSIYVVLNDSSLDIVYNNVHVIGSTLKCASLTLINSTINSYATLHFPDNFRLDGNNQGIYLYEKNYTKAVIKNVEIKSSSIIENIEFSGHVIFYHLITSSIKADSVCDYLEIWQMAKINNIVFNRVTCTMTHNIICNNIVLLGTNLTCKSITAKNSIEIYGFNEISVKEYINCSSISIEQSKIISPMINSSGLVKFTDVKLLLDHIISKSLEFHKMNVTNEFDMQIKDMKIASSSFEKAVVFWENDQDISISSDKLISIYISKSLQASSLSLKNVNIKSQSVQLIDLKSLDICNATLENVAFKFLDSNTRYNNITNKCSSQIQTINIDTIDVRILNLENVKLSSKNPIHTGELYITNSDVSEVDFIFDRYKCIIIRDTKDIPIYISQSKCGSVTIDALLSTKLQNVEFKVSNLIFNSIVEIDSKIDFIPIEDFILNCTKFMTVNISSLSALTVRVNNGILRGKTEINSKITSLHLEKDGHVENIVFSFYGNIEVEGNISDSIYCNGINGNGLKLKNANLVSKTIIIGILKQNIDLTQSTFMNINFEINYEHKNIMYFLITSDCLTEMNCSKMVLGEYVNAVFTKIILNIVGEQDVTFNDELSLDDATINGPIQLYFPKGIIKVSSNKIVDLYTKKCIFKGLNLDSVNLKSESQLKVDVQNLDLKDSQISSNISFNLLGGYISLTSDDSMIGTDIFINSITLSTLYLENINLFTNKIQQANDKSMQIISMTLYHSTTNNVSFYFIENNVKIYNDIKYGQVTVRFSGWEPETPGKIIYLNVDNVIVASYFPLALDVFSITAKNSEFINVSFFVKYANYGVQNSLVSTTGIVDLPIAGIDCQDLFIKNFNFKSEKNIEAKIFDLNLVNSTIDSSIIVTIDRDMYPTIESNKPGNKIYFKQIDCSGLKLRNIFMEAHSISYINVEIRLDLIDCNVSSNIVFNFEMKRENYISLLLISNKPITINVGCVYCINLECKSVSLIGYNSTNQGANTIAKISYIDLVNSHMERIDIDLKQASSNNSPDFMKISSNVYTTLNFSSFDAREYTFINISAKANSIINAKVEKNLYFENSNVDSNIVFQFGNGKEINENDVIIKSDTVIPIQIGALSSCWCNLSKVELIGNPAAGKEDVLIKVQSLSLDTSSMEKIAVDLYLVSLVNSIVESSPKYQTINTNNINANCLRLINVNFTGGTARITTGLELMSADADNTEFAFAGNEVSITSDKKKKILTTSVETVVFSITKIELATKNAIVITTQELYLDNSLLSDTMNVSLIGKRSKENEPAPLKVISDSKMIMRFNNIAEVFNNINFPISLTLENIDSNEVIQLDINKLYLKSSSVNNMVFTVKGSLAEVYGGNNNLQIKGVNVDTLTLVDAKVIKLFDGPYIVKNAGGIVKLVLKNVNIGDNSYFDISGNDVTIETDNMDIYVVSLVNTKELKLTSAKLNPYSEGFHLENCKITFHESIVSDNITFSYVNMPDVNLDGGKNSRITVTKIEGAKNLTIRGITVNTLEDIIITVKNLLMQGKVDLINIKFIFSDFGTNGICSIQGEGHTINTEDCEARSFHFNDINIEGTVFTANEIIMEKSRLSIINLTTNSADSFTIVDKSRFNQTFELDPAENIERIETLTVDAVNLLIKKALSIGHVNQLNGGTVKGEGVIADNFELSFEHLPNLDNLVQAHKYTVRLEDKMTVSTTNNEILLISQNVEYKAEFWSSRFYKLTFIPLDNPIELKNISTFDENIDKDIKKILDQIKFENNDNKFIFDGFSRLLTGLYFNINLSYVGIVKGTNPFVINLIQNSTIEATSNAAIFGKINFFDCIEMNIKGDVKINQGCINIMNSLNFVGNNAKLYFENANLTFCNSSAKAEVSSSFVIDLNAVYFMLPNGDNTKFSDTVKINNLYFDLPKDDINGTIPYIYGNGINKEHVSVIHNRNVTHDNMTLLSNLTCFLDFKGRNDALSNIFIGFIPNMAEGKVIKASCFMEKTYLYLPNEETAQQAVWISKKQFTTILIVGLSIFGAMLISFFLISIFNFHKLKGKESRAKFPRSTEAL